MKRVCSCLILSHHAPERVVKVGEIHKEACGTRRHKFIVEQQEIVLLLTGVISLGARVRRRIGLNDRIGSDGKKRV